jgi:hypothetical protein
VLAAEVDIQRQFDSRAMAAAQAAPGRLKREPGPFQGDTAWGAGVIYLIRFNKSERRDRAHSPGGSASAQRAGRASWLLA